MASKAGKSATEEAKNEAADDRARLRLRPELLVDDFFQFVVTFEAAAAIRRSLWVTRAAHAAHAAVRPERVRSPSPCRLCCLSLSFVTSVRSAARIS